MGGGFCSGQDDPFASLFVFRGVIHENQPAIIIPVQVTVLCQSEREIEAVLKMKR